MSDFPNKDLSNITTAVDEFHCPECDMFCPLDGYELNGKIYPEKYNKRVWYTELGKLSEWDEVYRCPKCGKVYKCVNSMYL